MVQRYYDDGHSITACQVRFGFARKTFMDAVRRGDVVTRPQAMPLGELLRRAQEQESPPLGLKENRCERCGIDEWLGAPLAMALHHVNGDQNDNSLDNLQLLCPNCHSQTDNFSGRNRKRPRAA